MDWRRMDIIFLARHVYFVCGICRFLACALTSPLLNDTDGVTVIGANFTYHVTEASSIIFRNALTPIAPTIMLKHLIRKETTLFQPPSFNRKRNYELDQTLGVGTFGKAVVRFLRFHILDDLSLIVGLYS